METPAFTMITGGVAILAIFISFKFHNKIMFLGTDAREITSANATTPEEQQLLNIVEELKISAGMQYMPRVYIIEADYMNAFASGFSEKSSLVAKRSCLTAKIFPKRGLHQ